MHQFIKRGVCVAAHTSKIQVKETSHQTREITYAGHVQKYHTQCAGPEELAHIYLEKYKI